MIAIRLNNKTFNGDVSGHKCSGKDDLDAGLDDEVEKELREFEQLQTGLLVTSKTGEEDGKGIAEEASMEMDNASGSDMELENLEEEIAEANKSISGQTPGRSDPPVLDQTSPSGDIRILPETFAEENLVGDDLVEKSGFQGDEEEPCLDLSSLQNLVEYAKSDPLRSPEPNHDDNDPDFPSPGRRKSRSKRPKSGRSEPRKTLQKKPRTTKSPVLLGEPQLAKEIQDPALQTHNKCTGTNQIGSFQRTSKEESVGPSPRFSVNLKRSDTIPKIREPVTPPQKSVEPDETLTDSFDALQSSQDQGQVSNAQAEKLGVKNFLENAQKLGSHVGAIDFGKISKRHGEVQSLRTKRYPVDVDLSSIPLRKCHVNLGLIKTPEHQEQDSKTSANSTHEDDNLENGQARSAASQSSPESSNVSREHSVSNCVVERILQRKYKSSLALDKEKLDFLEIDRPTIQCPELQSFAKMYESQVWLAACNELKTFFCRPCLIFGGRVIWCLSCDETTSENMFGREMNKHLQSPVHAESIKQLQTYKLKHKSSIIQMLLDRDFVGGGWTEKEQQKILESKPHPIFDASDPKSPDDITALKKFHDKFKWICSCSNTRKLFCWPCLLFGKNKWCFSGAISSQETAAFEHQSLQHHMEACFRLGKFEFDLQKNAESKEESEKLRRIVTGLAEILCAAKKKINNTDFSAIDFMDTLEVMSEYNRKLQITIDGKSKSSKIAAVQVLTASISDSVEYYVRSEIVEEIQNSTFLSLIFDHSSGISGKAILSVIARYVDTNGRTNERFVKLLNVGYNTPFSTLTYEFFLIIAELQCRSSLVGFTYDGYLVKPADIPSFNDRVQKFCPNAKFFHYAQHDFRRVLRQSLSHVPTCRRVLEAIKQLSQFFETTPGARKGLMDIVTAAESSNCNNIWKSSNFVTTVFVYHTVIVEIMDSICKRSQDFKVRTVVQAKNFLDFFKDSTNRFFVTLMARIFTTVGDLCAELDKEVGGDGLKTISSRTALKLQKLGKNFDNVVESACSHLESVEQENVRREMLTLRDQFSNIVRLVVKLVKNRIFGMDVGYFKITHDVDQSSGPTHCIKLGPDVFLQSVALPSTINAAKLSNELKFLNDSSISLGSSLTQIVADVVKYKMVETLPELFRFLQLALAIPKKLYGDSTFSAVLRISSYIEGKKELNCSDALFWMEKEFLTNLQQDPNFYQRVTDRVMAVTSQEVFNQFIE